MCPNLSVKLPRAGVALAMTQVELLSEDADADQMCAAEQGSSMHDWFDFLQGVRIL